MRVKSLTVWLLFALGTLQGQMQSFIRLSADRTHLIDPNGSPVFMVGDAPWSLIVQGTREDIDTYISNRAAKGFNVLLVNLIDKAFCQYCPSNIYKNPPFTTPGNFGTAAGATAYWAHADYAIGKARDAGMTLMLTPMYLGWACQGSEGWCPEVQAASLATMRAYGEFLGDRYKDYPNIIWSIGGDTDPVAYNVSAKLEAMVAGIKLRDRADRLFTAHNDLQSAQAVWGSASWLDLNNTHANGFTALMGQVATEYNRVGGKPLFHLEAEYEHAAGVTAFTLRQQAYGTALWGAKLGHMFGNCPLWGIGPGTNYPRPWCAQVADWTRELNSTGSNEFSYYGALMKSRHHWLFVPDHGHTVMTVGYGSGSSMATTALASDGSSIIAYIPSPRQITIDMSKIVDANGQAVCSWYNPRTGQFTSIGTYPNSGTRDFTLPDANDWVLVIDSSTAGSTARLATVSAASFASDASLAAGAIAAGFGQNLAPALESAPAGAPLPTALAGTSVKIRDSLGMERTAPLWFASPGQVNFLIPEGTALGPATLSVMRDSQTVATGALQIDAVAPGLFTMNNDGRGVPAARAVFAAPGGPQTWRYVFPPECQVGSCAPAPIDLGPETTRAFLELYGTGFRGITSVSSVTARMGGIDAAVQYVGPVAGMLGLDQVNLEVPRSLAGRGEVDLVVTAGGKATNTVRVNFQ